MYVPAATDVERAQRRAFGMKVREYREQTGLSQERLGHASGLDRTYVGSIERGERNVSLDNIYRLARALSVAPRDLLP